MNTDQPMRPRHTLVLALALVLGGSLLGASHEAAAGGFVVVAPPVALVEPIGIAPAPGYFWVGGYWNWVGGRHVWVHGRWCAPRAGYRWERHEWRHGERGWEQHGGYWARERR